MRKLLRFLTIVLALSGIGFSANYVYASTACNSSGELFDCTVFPAGMSEAAKDAACDCACAETYGTFGECDNPSGCCICALP